jgi:hypothetical protein
MWSTTLETAKAEVDRVECGLEIATEMEGYFTWEVEQVVQLVKGQVDEVLVDFFLQDVKVRWREEWNKMVVSMPPDTVENGAPLDIANAGVPAVDAEDSGSAKESEEERAVVDGGI